MKDEGCKMKDIAQRLQWTEAVGRNNGGEEIPRIFGPKAIR
jgi:hypothetical protein